MPIVTLTSDFGLQDFYVGLIKAAILSEDAQLNIVDISHNVNVYDIVQGAFILKNCFAEFPVGTVHIVSINNYGTKKPCFLAIRYAGHYFIGPDNGIFSLLFDKIGEGDVYELDYEEQGGFPIKHIFAKAVRHITGGMPFNEIGFPVDEIEERISFQPVVSATQIRGAIVHIDNYENVISNISKSSFEQVRNGRNFSVFFKRNDPIKQISKYYNEVAVGEPLCFFNASGYLEIAINMGKAASLLGLDVEDTIQVDFY